VKVEPLHYGDRKVYTVSAFNRGVSSWISRLPSLWIEGEVTEFRRQPGWQSVFFTLKDSSDGACLPVSMPRGRFDGLRLDLVDGMTVHVFGRPEIYEARGVFQLRALSIEPLGLGAILAGLERLKRKLASEGLFASERKRPLPLLPQRIGLLTGNEAAAKRDFVTSVQARFPAANILVAQTYVQGPSAPTAIVAALESLAREPDVDVIVVTRGGGSFEDLLPFSDERVVRAIASSAAPVVSAVGHEQPRRRQLPAWSCRTSTSFASASTPPGPRWPGEQGRLSSAHAACSPLTTSVSAGRRLCSSSASGRASRGSPAGCMRCLRRKHWLEDTPLSGRTTPSCARAPS
jgi:hypothetical protein